MSKRRGKTPDPQITMPRRDFTALINAVLPHSSRHEIMPAIRGVLLRTEHGRLTATATDRYTLGHRLGPETDQQVDVFLPLPHVRLILSTVKGRPDDEITLQFRPGEVGVKWGDTSLAVPSTDSAGFPKVDIARALATSTPCPSMVRLNADYAARFRACGDPYLDYCIGPRDRDPVLVVGDNFIGLIMPVRYSGDRGEHADWVARFPAPAEAVAS